MTQEPLQESIESLKLEIEKLKATDVDTKARIEALVQEIEDQADEPSGVIDNLQNLIETLEVEHPRITSLLNRMMMSLSNMGI